MTQKTERIAVLGCGYVGLPLAVALSQAGYSVTGIETSYERYQSLVAGKSYIEGVKDSDLRGIAWSHLPEDQTPLNYADVIIVCVPTPLREDKEPQLVWLTVASSSIAMNISKGTTVVLESTVYPGVTRNMGEQIAAGAGLVLGEDIHIGYSPERVDPGRPHGRVQDIPKLVAGDSPATLELLTRIYGDVTEVVPVESIEVAELSKLYENYYLAANIAIANEMTRWCYTAGISVWDVIKAASTKPVGFMPFYPGPGVGGHRLPIDIHYLRAWGESMQMKSKVLESVIEANESMPYYAYIRAVILLSKPDQYLVGKKVGIWGVSYKEDISDTRESPVRRFMEYLVEAGAKVWYYDPWVPEFEVKGQVYKSVLAAVHTHEIMTSDLMVVAVAHSCFGFTALADEAKMILDLRGVVPPGPNVHTL